MSAPEIVELIASRGGAEATARRARERGIELPAMGRVVGGADGLALCVRPQRWLLLAWPADGDTGRADGALHAHWQEASAGIGAAVELSSAYAALRLAGLSIREALARGCRLDLHPLQFPAGHAAATTMAQVPVILAALPAAMLVLTPASTARHFRAWLASTLQPFGLMAQSPPGLADGFRSRAE